MNNFSSNLVKKANIAFFDKISKKYDSLRRVPFGRAAAQLEIENIKIVFKDINCSHNRVLSIGCGTGSIILNLSLMGLVKNAFGLDISMGMLTSCKNNSVHLGQDIKLIRADAEVLPFRERSFDLIIARGTLHHLPNYEKCICDCYKALKPKGTFIFIEPSSKASKIIAVFRWMFWSILFLIKIILKTESERLIDIRTFRFEEIVKVAKQSGFSSVTIKPFTGFSSRIFYWLTDPIARVTNNELIHSSINKIINILRILDDRVFFKFVPGNWVDEFIAILEK